MVRINLVDPKCLADQHLVAEYDEVLMLLGYVRRFPLVENIPENYVLGKGHIKFFKNKLKYLKNRHEILKKEMLNRGFKPVITIKLSEFSRMLCNDWKPKTKDYIIIKKRISSKLKLKPEYYRYYGEHKYLKFFLDLLK